MDVTGGIYYPVITPFTEDGSIDHDAFRELINFGLDRGMEGVFATGTSGQGPEMSLEQQKDALDTTFDQVDGRVPIIAHTGRVSTHESVELAQYAEELGADMIALLPKYYYQPEQGDHEIMMRFKRVAEAVDLDLVIYQNPKYAYTDITPSDVAELIKEVPSVKGIKVSFAGLKTIVRYVTETPDDFVVFSGSVDKLYPGIHHGVDGVINPPYSVFPEVQVEFWEAIQNNDTDRCVELQAQMWDLMDLIGEFSNEFGRSVFVDLYGFRGIDIESYPRWDTKTLGEDDRVELRRRVEELGLGEYLQ